MENHEVQPYDVSCIDVKFPVCDHQLEIKGEEQVQVLKSSTIKCLWLLMHGDHYILPQLPALCSALQSRLARPFLTWHKCCHISAASPVIPSQMEACVCWWMQGNSSVNYDPFTENKSQWCVQYDHVGVLYGTVACTALALRIPGFQHLLCCCSSFPQSRLDTRPANISEPVINKKAETRKH